MPPRQSLSRRLGAAVATTAVTMSTALFIVDRAAAAPSYTMEERAFAIAAPASAYLEARLTGRLRHRVTGELLHQSPIVYTRSCSGFVVGGNGHVLTNSRCVQPDKDSMRRSAAEIVANERIKVNQLAADQKESFIKGLISTGDFTGDQPNSAPAVKVFVQLFQGQSGLTSEPAMPADLVEARPLDQGELALLKLAQGGLPAVELSSQPLNLNTPVVLVGFGSDSPTTPATYTARSVSAKITGRYRSTSPPVYQVDQELGWTSYGGMVVDSNGRIVGMINTDHAAKGANRLITNLDDLTKLLATANVSSALSQADQTYRSALDDYFGGRYREAIRKLDSVLVLMPEHAIAINYRRQASERLAIEGDASGSALPGWLLITLIAVGGVLILVVIIVAILFLRQRSRTAELMQGLMYDRTYPISGIPASVPPPISALPISAPQMLHDTQGHGYDGNAHGGMTLHDQEGGAPGNPWAPPGPRT